MRFQSHRRNTEAEWMDDPLLDPIILDQAVADINTVNHLLGGYKFTKAAVQQVINENPQESYKIIDFGCSDGAMLRYLAQELPQEQLDLLGVDLSPRSIQQAQEKSRDFERIRFRESDIFKTPVQDLKCDILLVTLTLHHFAEEEVLRFLKRFQEMAGIAIIINDLHRSPIAYNFFKIFSPIFIKNEISMHDGLISIASGFKRSDFKRYAKQLEIINDRLTWKWSFRFIWIIPTHERNN
ncbi:methyltransferase domain-containing protein [Nonlabens marinus]|uniref:SAM-dependent methyltransferases n=1 Tax=Nonlabens marinus S1-08 TaxID=1454201 RepID=W8VSM0_9FLAO|nr:methyltransferase domain-containing protein [Nonlabens marinus]BAO56320.1 SAM-dependent methyltransferases [Nonlabens marinus S1-08]